IPELEEIPYWKRKKPPGRVENFHPFQPDGDLVPPIAHAGDGYRVHFTGLTHDERGYPDMNPDTHNKLITRLANKIIQNADHIIRTEDFYLDDAEILVISYGCTARSARRAVREAREAGIKVGMLRLISIWPFPENLIRNLANQVDVFIVAEMNLGQVRREVERLVHKPVKGIHHAGGMMIPPQPIHEAIQEVNKHRN
ncbi:hypothetical protein AMJ86_08225, partial [bacterium SM23_57]